MPGLWGYIRVMETKMESTIWGLGSKNGDSNGKAKGG